MLPKMQNECNVIEMFPKQGIDFSALIPQSILPDSEEELENLMDIENDMADDEGMDAMPESMFNALIEYLLSKDKTRDVLMFTAQANFGIRHSDLIKLRLIQLIDVDGKFRDKVCWQEQKTSKVRKLIINDAVKAATIIYLKAHPEKKLTDYLFTAEGKHKGYKKVMYIDDNGKKKAKRENGKYIYELDEYGKPIPEPLRRSQAETVLKNSLYELGFKLKNDKRCQDGEYKINSHSLRKAYASQFGETAFRMKETGEIQLDANILQLVQMDLAHTSLQTTMRYNKSFDKVKEQVCRQMNLGLNVLQRYI